MGRFDESVSDAYGRDLERKDQTMTSIGTGKGPSGNEMKTKMVATYNKDGSRTFTMYANMNGKEMKMMEFHYTRVDDKPAKSGEPRDKAGARSNYAILRWNSSAAPLRKFVGRQSRTRLVVYQWQQLVRGAGIPRFDSGQDPRDVAHRQRPPKDENPPEDDIFKVGGRTSVSRGKAPGFLQLEGE